MSTLSQTRPYHHGELRAALVEAGLAALQSNAHEDISLRALAREVGVSPTAVYRHYPDKAALFRDLADEGLDRLGRYQKDAAGAALPDQAFSATGRAYVRWALSNPALFRLIFVCIEPVGETVFGQSLPAQLLQANAAASTNDPVEARRRTVQAWALVHGLATLILDGLLPADDEFIEGMIEPNTLFPR